MVHKSVQCPCNKRIINVKAMTLVLKNMSRRYHNFNMIFFRPIRKNPHPKCFLVCMYTQSAVCSSICSKYCGYITTSPLKVSKQISDIDGRIRFTKNSHINNIQFIYLFNHFSLTLF